MTGFPYWFFLHKLDVLVTPMRKFAPILLFWMVLASVAEAQSFYSIRRERSLIAVGGIGTSTYFGELANDGTNIDAKPSLSVGLQYFLTRQLSVRSELTYFRLKGADAEADDNSRVNRNLSFTSGNVELNVVGMLNFFPQGRRFYQRPSFNVYGFGGLGFLYFNPKTDFQGSKVALQPLKTELVDYSRLGIVIPFGIGVRLKAGPFYNLTFEGGYRKAFTDYLDDVSTVHPGAAAFTDPVAAALSDRRPELGLAAKPAGTQRGNPDDNDGYFILSAKLEYYLPDGFLFSPNSQQKLLRNKRKAFYRYNKRGGLKRR